MLAYQGVLLTRATLQTIPNNAETAVSWNAEIHDVGEYHEATIQPTWILVPTGLGGTYNIYASVEWAASGTGLRRIGIFVNSVEIAQTLQPTISGGQLSLFASTSYILAEGDVVTIKVYQSSGGDLDIVRTDPRTPIFGIDLLGV